MPDISTDVVGEIDHADFHGRSGDADGSDKHSHSGFLVSGETSGRTRKEIAADLVSPVDADTVDFPQSGCSD